MKVRLSLSILPVLTVFTVLAACDGPPIEAEVESSVVAPGAICSDYTPLKRAYFGELHLHTSWSIDAHTFGTRNGPVEAYAFARGSPLTLTNGRTVRLDRPLDFAAVTDHSENLAGNLWAREGAIADAANDPCRFTAFRGYEYSLFQPSNANQHRNIIFANSNVPNTPYDSLAYPTPEQLWRALSTGCTTQSGCDVIAIPHNSNQSQGQKFLVESYDLQTALLRNRYEVLAEVFQGKGASECLNTVDPADDGYDPACEFEILDSAVPSDAPGYVRNGLTNGLEYFRDNGVNPLRFGLIGATDTHNGTAGYVSESAWQGNHGNVDDTPRRRLTAVPDANPGGIAVVWAEQNTRESIFAAFKRRETYGTSGPRMIVRFYQTWDTANHCADSNFPAGVAASGVPMGGLIHPNGQSVNPRFVIHAAKDSRNLARIDVIKVRLVNGQPVEEVISLPATHPTLGDAVMCRTWIDSTWNPNEPAFYYARVLEKPTWRWSHYDCAQAPAFCTRDEQIQERAWTSPIWNLPGNPPGT